jgi:hypothetical protein
VNWYGFWLRAAVVAAATLLSSCGGGGGGGDSTGSTPPPSNSSGLVPPALPLGATLVNDATTLRPLIAGATWTYVGTRSSPGTTTQTYVDVVTQQAGTGGAMLEQVTNANNGGAFSQTVSFRNGEVHSIGALDIGAAQATQLDQVELRSPVRVNDQYTLLDVANQDVGFDVDGDGRNETYDAAMYSSVVGEEVIDLPGWNQARTIRVKTVLQVRGKSSRTGQQVQESLTLETWYAHGVGVVQRITDSPGAVAGTRETFLEMLSSFDGLTHGVGALPTQPATNPTSGAQLRSGIDALGFSTQTASHALLLSLADPQSGVGIALSTVDTRGHVTATQVHAIASASTARMTSFAGMARVLTLQFGTGLRLDSFLPDGSASGSPVIVKPGAVTQLNTGEFFATAGTDDALWVVWMELVTPNTLGPYVLLAQPFDANGQALANASTLLTPNTSTAVRNLRAAGSGNRLLVSWDDGLVTSYAMVRLNGATGTFTLGEALAQELVRPGGTSAGPALLWVTHGVGGGSPGRFCGVNFDASDQPQRTTTGPAHLEVINVPWVSDANFARSSSDGTHQDSWMRDGTGSTSVVIETTPGPGPLAANSSMRLLARGEFPFTTMMVSFPGQLLMFGDDLGAITVTPVWRRP